MISSVINLSMLGSEKKKKTNSTEITNFMTWLNLSIGLEGSLLCSQIIVIASIISSSLTINFSSLSGPGLNVVLVVLFCKMTIELKFQWSRGVALVSDIMMDDLPNEIITSLASFPLDSIQNPLDSNIWYFFLVFGSIF